jgi:curved DNA-binding protein CbpA
VQISLDFYRILGVPTRATPEQLQQAFEDRLQQLPRQDYSNAAIAARKQLLEEAFVVLADPKKREDYDKQWVDLESPANPADGLGLMLDIADAKLSGALLLLQEVGAYQQILDIGAAYLQRPIDLNKIPTHAGALEDDVILAVALAHLELGREQWQQSQFEGAGDSLQKGLTLLQKEQRFADVQLEIKGDLYKLRPYRILELLNDPEISSPSRAEGLTLLQAMLEDRDGIDGNQDDQSGLSVNDFLRFIQQLREYMTVEEQQTLFEHEAARPSAVASYLAVYALIAKGVSQGKPRCVERAKSLLVQLGDRQDIAIEEGMCWLLLGQPDAAHRSVSLSQDQESLDFLAQYSQGSPDLIPGLYLYTENWLQQEVYPYFRDLAGQSVSLRHYFNDPAIQEVLNTIDPATSGDAKPKSFSPGATVVPNAQTKIMPEAAPFPLNAPKASSAKAAVPSASDSLASLFPDDPREEVFSGSESASSPFPAFPSPQPKPRRSGQKQPKQSSQTRGTRRPEAPRNGTAVGAAPGSRSRRSTGFIALLLGVGFVAGAVALARLIQSQPAPSTAESPTTGNGVVAIGSAPPTTQTTPSTSVSSSTSPSVSPTVGNSSSGSSPAPTVSPSPVAAPPGTLSRTDAEQLVKSWQTAKAEAMSEQYNTANLQSVLLEPALSEWKNRVAQNKAAKGYWKYTLDQLEIQTVDNLGKGRSAIKAKVKETAQYFEDGKLVKSQSYTDSYPVRYTALQQGSQWHIQDMQVQ